MRSLAAVASVVLAACALTPRPLAPAPAETVAIVASERGPRGFRLIAVDEHGDRQFEMVTPVDVSSCGQACRDDNPAISPDGRWLVFASTRDRSDGGTSLWIAPVGLKTTPRRLTAAGIDQHPVWTVDGRAIVFASTRYAGDFDLWQLAIDATGHPGKATQLTSAPGHEVTPAVAPDGTILYAAVTPHPGGEVESRIEERALDGTTRAITSGPADMSPAISPDGSTLVFVRPSLHLGTPHAGLWRIDRGAWQSRSDTLPARPLVRLPITDETGPVWSRDGRFVFATSVLRGEGGKVVFSSIVHVDLHERTPRARMLRDRSGAEPRLTPAIRSRQLDAAALDADPEYLPELARIVTAAIASQSP